MFSRADSEVNPLASFLALIVSCLKSSDCQSRFHDAKNGLDTFPYMKKRIGLLLMIISVLATMWLAGCSENSAWKVGPEGIPLNSAPSGTSGSSGQ
jgi:hypothetical protein